MSKHSSGGVRGVLGFAPPMLLFGLALVVRALPAPTVLFLDRVQPFGNDALYHLRRVAYSLHHFPAILEFDSYLNYPHGGRAIWTPAFDWLTALVLWPWIDPGDLPALERAAVWVPPLLGAGTVVALYFVALRQFGRGTAFLAGLFLALSSAHFWYSQLGFLDHHAAVALVTTWLLGAGLATARRYSDASTERGTSVGSAAGLAVAYAGSLLIWPGTLLHVGLVACAVLVLAPTRAGRATARGCAREAALAHGIAAVLVWPFCDPAGWSQWGRFSPAVLTGFQPWLLGTLALHHGGCALLWRRGRHCDRTSGRLLAAGLWGVSLLVISAFVIPELRDGLEDAWRWFGRTESFQAQVNESRPILVQGGEFTTEIAIARLTPFFLLVPLVVGVAAWRTRRRADVAPLWLFLAWTLGLVFATLAQRRFFNSSSVAVSLLLAWTVGSIDAALRGRFRAGSRRLILARGAVGLGLALMLAPMIGTYRRHVANHLSGPVRASHTEMRHRLALQTARWIQRRTPATSGWLNPEGRPEYGVMAPWSVGHVIVYTGQRPAVNGNFGDDVGPENFALAGEYFAGDETAGLAILERLNARYVVAEAASGTGSPESLQQALALRDGSEAESGPALARHRLVFESESLAPGGRPQFQVYEVVPGALVSGTARSGAEVRAQLRLRSRARDWVYKTRVDADADGHYALRLPYSNVGAATGVHATSSVRAAAAYELTCEGDRAELVVDENSVRSGGVLSGPALCPPPVADPALL